MVTPDGESVRRFRTGDALAHGSTRAQLRAKGIRHPFHGVCATGTEEQLTDRSGRPMGDLESAHLARARDHATVLGESACFSHVTAAVVWGIPLPFALLRDALVHVTVVAPARLPRGKGVRGHQTPDRLVVSRADPRWNLRVTTPAVTWAMLGSMLRDQRDLVAAGDAVVRTWRVADPLATTTELEAAVAAGRRVGIGRLRAALPLIRPRSASRPETWARLALIDGGLPEPCLNWDVHAHGEREACVDLAYPEYKVAVEYEGEHHLLDPEQWNSDIRRYERLAELGWVVIRVTKVELFEAPHLFVARVRRALRVRGA
jgi:hypothetical protein